jgi:hypothetical protein
LKCSEATKKQIGLDQLYLKRVPLGLYQVHQVTETTHVFAQLRLQRRRCVLLEAVDVADLSCCCCCSICPTSVVSEPLSVTPRNFVFQTPLTVSWQILAMRAPTTVPASVQKPRPFRQLGCHGYSSTRRGQGSCNNQTHIVQGVPLPTEQPRVSGCAPPVGHRRRTYPSAVAKYPPRGCRKKEDQ